MKKFYAIANGRTTGVVESWDECKKSTQGFSRAKFKGFDTREEAVRWLNTDKIPLDSQPTRIKNVTRNTTDYIIYTDGSCLKNPGPGGYAAIIIDTYSKNMKEISGGAIATTNNRMELSAAIEALKILPENSDIILYTDSQYLQNAFIQNWLINWKINGWKTATGKEVANKDLWVELDRLVKKHHIDWQWVKGHNNVKYNERCDVLANTEAKKYKALLGGIKCS